MRILQLGSAVFISLLVAHFSFAQINQNKVNQLSGADTAVNTIPHGVPFLRITPDARAGGMGDLGVATSPDVHSIHWNASKLAFGDKNMSVAASYTPWLQELVNDIYLANLSGYKRIDPLQTVGLSLNYFNLGQIQFTDRNGQDNGQFRPHQFSVNAAYARKLSDNLSGGIVLKYIYSNLASGQEVNGVSIQAGHAVAGDLSVYYHKDLKISGNESKLRLGANASNIGSKISYTKSGNKKAFLPSNLGTGASLSMKFDKYNELALNFEMNKLLLPTPDPRDTIPRSEISVARGVFQSFADAPGGFNEEMHEIILAGGIEYWYAQQFAVRGGYFNEHSTKGNRKYFTLGVGLRFNVFGLDVSYLIPTNMQRSPLDNTLRFTLSFDFTKEEGEEQKTPNEKS